MRAVITLFVDADVLLAGDFRSVVTTVVASTVVLFVESSGFSFDAISSTILATVLARKVLLAAGVLTTIFSASVSVASVVTFPSAARTAFVLLLYLSGLLLLTLLGLSVTPVR